MDELHTSPFSPEPLSALFQRPLIAGASVSADYRTASPGKRLAGAYTAPAQIRTIANSGRPGLEVAPQLTSAILQDRTILIAIDLFFWDSTLRSAERSISELESLLARAKHLPVVLGDIPALLPQMQPQLERMNTAIRGAAKAHGRCSILAFSEIHRELLRKGSLPFGGRSVGVRELIPDGLHLSETASLYLVEKLRAVIPN